jgi:hypothetical protein
MIVVPNKQWYWQTLRTINKNLNFGKTSINDIGVHIEEQYGVRWVLNGDGLISDQYEVVDDEKHTIFLLKYA